jgi:hypothetical protein
VHQQDGVAQRRKQESSTVQGIEQELPLSHTATQRLNLERTSRGGYSRALLSKPGLQGRRGNSASCITRKGKPQRAPLPVSTTATVSSMISRSRKSVLFLT